MPIPRVFRRSPRSPRSPALVFLVLACAALGLSGLSFSATDLSDTDLSDTGLSGEAAPNAAETWPHWRGPSLDGTAHAANLPTEWQATGDGKANVRWRRELPGPAGSTPLVWGDAIYLTSADADGDGLSVLAYGTDGTPRWQTEVDSGSVDVFPQLAHETNAAAPSPVTDGEHLWALFGTAKLYCLALGGENPGQVMWTVDLAERYGAPSLYFGYSASPLLHNGRLVLHLLHGEDQRVIALDAATGEELWNVERATDAEKESLHSYASPLPFTGSDGTEQILIHGADYLTGHDAATGRELWRFGTLNPKASYNPTYRFVTSPTVHGDLIVVPTAKRGPVYGLRPGDARGALATDGPQVVWTLERGTPDVPSPVVSGGLVYLAGENGRLTVLDVETGEEIYAERAHQSPHRASPVVADGKVYLAGTDGVVTVVKTGPSFEVLAQNTVDAGRLASTPAVVGDTIYLRTHEALFAISTSGDPADSAPEARADSKDSASSR